MRGQWTYLEFSLTLLDFHRRLPGILETEQNTEFGDLKHWQSRPSQGQSPVLTLALFQTPSVPSRFAAWLKVRPALPSVFGLFSFASCLKAWPQQRSVYKTYLTESWAVHQLSKHNRSVKNGGQLNL